ncbi:MAG: hypothetical protein HRU15_16745 [Planctomycetes bacterium]|nr:hypothetical protein [Planctomycetota bacterium]
MQVIIIAIVGLSLLILQVFLALRFTPIYCSHCYKKLQRFSDVPEEQKISIRKFIKEHEDRAVDESAVYVCQHCNHVSDDFSGEQRNREVDRTYQVHGRMVSSMRCICKICGVLVMDCSPQSPEIHCQKCETQYTWKLDEESGLIFLIREGDRKVLDGPKDMFGMA